MNRRSPLEQGVVGGQKKTSRTLNSPASPREISIEVWKERPSQLYPAGTELFRQGSRAEQVWLIERGLVKLLRLEEDGQEMIIRLRYPGWFVGITATILQRPYPATAVTLTPCRLRRIPAEDFRRQVEMEDQFSRRLLQALSREVSCAASRQRISAVR